MGNLDKYTKPFSGKKRTEEPEDKGYGINCCAHGCPLVGTISDSNHGGPFKCWAHDRTADAVRWPAVTQGINENIWIFRAADKILGMPIYRLEHEGEQATIDNFFKSRGLDHLARKKNDGEWSERIKIEPVSSWVMRIRQEAYKMAIGA